MIPSEIKNLLLSQISKLLLSPLTNICHIVAQTLDVWTLQGGSCPGRPWGAIVLGCRDSDGLDEHISINFLVRKCSASSACRFCWCQQFSPLLGNLPWSNASVELNGLFEMSTLGRCSVQTTLDMVSENFAKQFCAKQSVFLAVKADKIAATGCQDLRLSNWADYRYCSISFVSHDILLSMFLCVGNLAPQDLFCHPDPLAGKTRSAGNQKSKELHRAWPQGNPFFHVSLMVSLIQAFPSSMA